ncbi:hypothetical protein [Photobacterium sp. R1]
MGKIITILLTALAFTVYVLSAMNYLEPTALCDFINKETNKCDEWSIKAILLLGGYYFLWGAALGFVVNYLRVKITSLIVIIAKKL